MSLSKKDAVKNVLQIAKQGRTGYISFSDGLQVGERPIGITILVVRPDRIRQPNIMAILLTHRMRMLKVIP